MNLVASSKRVYFILKTIGFIGLLIQLEAHTIILEIYATFNEDSTTSTNESITFVSTYFDISRLDRPREEYFKWIRKTIQLNAPFIFFTQSKNKNELEKIFKTKTNHFYKIITIELEDLEYYSDFDRVKQILESQEYKDKILHPERIECVNPLYSIVIHSKLDFLLKASQLNPFNTTKFIWIDAGISRFFGNFKVKQKLTGRHLFDQSFFITIDCRAFEDRDFQMKNESLAWTARNFLLAGIMGGTREAISDIAYELRKKWKYLLEKRVVNNEQMNLLLVYFDRPNLFNLKAIEIKNWNLREIFKALI